MKTLDHFRTESFRLFLKLFSNVRRSCITGGTQFFHIKVQNERGFHKNDLFVVTIEYCGITISKGTTVEPV